MQKLAVTLVVALVAALTVAACGSSSSSSSSSTSSGGGGGGGGGATSTKSTAGGGGPAQSVPVSADPSGALRFQQSTLSAKAGSVTFKFTNAAPVTHNFCLQSSSGKQLGCSGTISGGATDSLSTNVTPGTYTFYCNVDGHEAAGMKGTLTVK